MEVTIKTPGILKENGLAGNTRLTVKEGITPEDLFDLYGMKKSAASCTIIRNGMIISRTDKLSEGDIIDIFIPVLGG